ncbi:hypothetical protein BH11PAT4_BH11PAT4_5030 [soil metagenome]
MPKRPVWTAAVALLLTLGFGVAPTLAAGPSLDSGKALDAEKPYENAQVISDVFSTTAVYGKLLGDIPIDIYKFVPDRDGDQTISLYTLKEETGPSSEPLLILMDPTDATEAKELGLPLPSDAYHSATIAQDVTGRTISEPLLLQSFVVSAEQRIALKKDKEYFLIVLDPGRVATHYAVKFGDAKVWGAGTIFTDFGTWFKLKTDSFASTSPFYFNPSVLGVLFLLLGLMASFGMWLVLQIFTLGANRSKSAAYLLIKLQPFSRIVTWSALWLVLLGSYIYFSRTSWFGLPFAAIACFIPSFITQLVETFVLNPQLRKIDVAKREAEIPLTLRKKLFVAFVINTLSFAATITFLSMYFVKI